MGRVRTKTVKKASRQMIERYYSKMTLNVHTNKNILEEIAIILSKCLRNKIAGFSTHLMKHIQRCPVRGISLKLQEEERERRMDFMPDESAIRVDRIEVSRKIVDLLESLGMKDLPGIVLREEQEPIRVEAMVTESKTREMGVSCSDAIRISALDLVYLARSERIIKTGPDGVGLKE